MATVEMTPANLGAPSANKVLRHLKRQEQGLYNCVASVVADAAFVQEMAALHPELPVVANLRCGAWYVPRPDATCYFKSMDGHMGQWAFSLARLNWHLALLAASRDGCFIVDATRRGKTFPDALTKTIPIWAAALNSAVAYVQDQQQAATAAADAVQKPAQHSQQESRTPTQPPQDCPGKGQPPEDPQPSQAAAAPPPAPASPKVSAAIRASAPLPTAAGGHCRGEPAVSSCGSSCSSDWGGGSVASICKPPGTGAVSGRSGAGEGAASGRDADAGGAAAGWDTELHLPLWISASERRQIEARLPGFVQQLLEVGVDIGALAAALRKPLRPLWLSPASRVWLNHVPDLCELPFTPLFLVSASQPERCRMLLGSPADAEGSDDAQAIAFDYVPGAGDDEESWARGLTPALLWGHRQALLAAGPAGIADLAAELAASPAGIANFAAELSHGGSGAAGTGSSQQEWRRPHSGAALPPAADPHRPPPLGCAPGGLDTAAGASSGGPVAVAAGPCSLWRLSGTGLALAQLPVGDMLPAEIWQHADAVLDLGSGNRRHSCSGAAAAAEAAAVTALHQQGGGVRWQHAEADGGASVPEAAAEDGTARCSAAGCSARADRSGSSSGADLRVGGNGGLAAAAEDAAQQQPQQQHWYMWRHVLSAKGRRTSLLEALPSIAAFVAMQLSAGRRLLIGSDEGLDVPAAAAVAVLLACFTAPAAGEQPGDWTLQTDLGSGPCGVVASSSAAAADIGQPWNESSAAAPVQSANLGSDAAASGAAAADEPQQQSPVQPSAARVHKADLRRCLAFVSGSCPEARPSQGLLKQVFAHFEIISGHNRHFQAQLPPE